MHAGRFDKTARLLNIPKIPGGPELEKLAAKGQPRFELPVRPQGLFRLLRVFESVLKIFQAFFAVFRAFS